MQAAPSKPPRRLRWRCSRGRIDGSSGSRALALRRFPIQPAFGELGQQLVRLPLFIEGLLEELDSILLAQEAGPGADRPVAGDLIVLYLLRAADQAGIQGVGVAALAQQLFVLGNDAGQAPALLPRRLL